jgi:FkbM family methyltransferase
VATTTTHDGAPRPGVTEYLKHLVVGSPLEAPATQLRRMREVYLRVRAPELTGIWTEPRHIDAALRRLIHPGHNVVDVGAHLGSFTSLALRLSPTGHHIAVEALPHKAAWLRRKFPDVEVVAMAVSDSCGEITFHHNVDRSGYSGIDAHVEEGDHLCTLTVPMTRIDDIVPAGHLVDFLKIDVEGAELRALHGATRVLDESRPALLFECTISTTDAATRRALHDFFTCRGYDIWMVGAWLEGQPPVSPDAFEASMTYPYRGFNFLALPPRQRGL